MKTYRQFIMEMPIISNSAHTKEQSNGDRELYVSAIRNNGTKVGKGIYHAGDEDGHHLYASGNKDNPNTVHVVKSNHVQDFVSKTHHGSTSDALNVMNYHVRKHGKLESDHIQTSGGKHLWTQWVKSKPKGVSFHYKDENGKTTPIDHATIDDHASRIWNINAINTKLVATKTKE